MRRFRIALVAAGTALGVARLAWSAFTPGSAFVFQAFAGSVAQQQAAPAIEPWIVGGTVTVYEDHVVHSKEIVQGNNELVFTKEGLNWYSTFSGIAVAGASDESADQISYALSTVWHIAILVSGWGAPYDGKWFSTTTFSIVPTNTQLVVGRIYFFKRFSPGTVSLQIIQYL